LDQFDTLVFAADQETNYFEIDESNFAQIQSLKRAAITHYRSDELDKVRAKSAAQPQPFGAPVELFFNLQHFGTHAASPTIPYLAAGSARDELGSIA